MRASEEPQREPASGPRAPPAPPASPPPPAPEGIEARRAFVTGQLVALNVALFVALLVATGSLAPARPTRPFPGSTSPSAWFLAFGANYAPFVVREGRLELLVTSCFLHFSIMHIAFNMVALRQVGGFVERAVGAARFASVYLAAGIAGAATSAAWGILISGAERISVGASGAISGVCGAALVLGVRLQGWGGPLVRAMGLWLLLTIGLGFAIGSDNAAHVGGTLTGAAMAAAFRRGHVYSPLRVRVTLGTCTAIVVASMVTLALRDRLDPWATRDKDARTEIAQRALASGRCDQAKEAAARAARLAGGDGWGRELVWAARSCEPSR